jgi:hypothetical protein
MGEEPSPARAAGHEANVYLRRMSDTYTVERAVTIDAAPDRVYGHIADFHNWEAWSPWEEMDPAMEKTYMGPDSGPGARYAWSGNRKVGEGSMVITEATEPSLVHIDLEFLKPFRASNKTTFSLTPAGDATRVSWTMTGAKTLFTRIMGIFKSMDAMVGPDFERGLANLKATAEGNAS